MPNISEDPKTWCKESIECYYKTEGTCTFWEKVRELLTEHQEKYHKGSNSIINVADTYELPCKVLDEKGRQHGIGNLFADLGTMH